MCAIVPSPLQNSSVYAAAERPQWFPAEPDATLQDVIVRLATWHVAENR
jgi:hypothetical protein